jgi:hypothetical protein
VLRLDSSGNYIQEIWREEWAREYKGESLLTAGQHGNFRKKEVYSMIGGDGQPLKEIPFMFVGSDNNDSAVDSPNFYDLASLNIAHYRNSADYEEACYIVGQPTVVMTGLNEKWYEDVLKGKISFGSRGGIPLPVGADAKLLQAEERSMLKEAMEAKERQMTALGAKLVQQREVQRTATESKIENASESSVLANIAKNVSAAYKWALEWCAVFLNLSEAGIEFSLNDDFDISALTPEQQQQVVAAWQAGALSWEEMRAALKKAGIATEDDAKVKESIKKDAEAQLGMEAKFAESGAVA